MMSMQSSTHSSQMNTVGPAMSLRTSCCDLPQNEQYRVFFESGDLLMRTPAPDSRGASGRVYPPSVGWDKDHEWPLSRSRHVVTNARSMMGWHFASWQTQDLPPVSSGVGRFSTTSSTRPKSRLSSADMYVSRSSLRSIASSGWPVWRT